MVRKAPLRQFLSKNPFPNGWTDGLFYREKMRAIHRVAPVHIEVGRVLEIGGGRSGLGSYLFPGADITTLDLDYDLGRQLPANAKTMFVGGDACRLPFA